MLIIASMSVILTVRPKCTLAASHAAPLSYGEYADGTDRQTDGCHNVTLRFPLDAAGVKISI